MTAAPPALLVLDAGTSAMRASAWRNGAPVAEARRPLAILFPAPGHAEQDAAEIRDAARACLEEAARALPADTPAVLAITNQRSTVVLWDADDGHPLGPALSWRDSRAGAEAAQLAGRVPDLAGLTGLLASPHYGAPKITWALREWRSAREAADRGRLRVGPISTWIGWCLTGGESFHVDPTNAQRLLLMDLHALAWHAGLVDAAGIPRAALPSILPNDGLFGTARLEGRAVPIRLAVGDQQATLLGLPDALQDGRAVVHLGTGGFVLAPTGGEVRRVPGLLTGLAFAALNRPRIHVVEGPVSSAGSAFDRLRDAGILHAGEDLDALVAQSLAPAVVVPAWAGLAAPDWEPAARGAVLGWDEAVTRADLVAGTVRGVAFLVARVVESLRAGGLPVESLLVSGPLSETTCVPQALADATQLPVHVRAGTEASLIGAARALAEAAGAPPPALPDDVQRSLVPQASPTRERAAFERALKAVLDIARSTS